MPGSKLWIPPSDSPPPAAAIISCGLPATSILIGVLWANPVIIDVKGTPQMLVLASEMGVTPDGLQSFNPADGHRLWWCKGGGDASSPAYGDGIVYFDSGRGGPGFAIDPTGTGDVSATHVKWTVDKLSEAIGSPVIVGDYVYRLQSPGVNMPTCSMASTTRSAGGRNDPK